MLELNAHSTAQPNPTQYITMILTWTQTASVYRAPSCDLARFTCQQIVITLDVLDWIASSSTHPELLNHQLGHIPKDLIFAQ